MKKVFILVLSTLFMLMACQTNDWTDQIKNHFQNQSGGEWLLKAIHAHGGLDKWHENGLLHFTWTYHMTDMGPNAIVSSTQTIDTRTMHTLHTVKDQTTRFGFNENGYWIHPSVATFMPPARFWTLTPLYFVGAPFVFADLSASATLMEDNEFEGKTYKQVKITYAKDAGDTPDDYYILFIDPDKHSIKGMCYIVTSELVTKNGPLPETFITLDDLVNVDGLLLPTNHRSFYVDKGKIMEQKRFTKVTDLSFKTSGSVDFATPDGAKSL